MERVYAFKLDFVTTKMGEDAAQTRDVRRRSAFLNVYERLETLELRMSGLERFFNSQSKVDKCGSDQRDNNSSRSISIIVMDGAAFSTKNETKRHQL